MLNINDRVALAPPFDKTSDMGGTVTGFEPSATEGDDYAVVRWDDGTEARFAQGALVSSSGT